ELAVWWTLGDAADVEGGTALVPSVPAPFSRLVVAPRGAQVRGSLLPFDLGEAHALLQGWPALGHEIDDRTLPQEVRFDELRGVDYDKGCYVGQETVARLHFRGHANRILRAWVGREAVPGDGIVSLGGKEIGRATRLLVINDAWIATG